MNKSQFKDIVEKIHQSTKRVAEEEVRRDLSERENVLLIASVSKQRFSKLIAFLQTLERQNFLWVWAQKEYRETMQNLDQDLIKYVDHEGSFAVESEEFAEINENQYDVIIFCVQMIDRYRNMNLEYICSKLSQNCETVIYSFDDMEEFVLYNDIENHIKLIENYKNIIEDK